MIDESEKKHIELCKLHQVILELHRAFLFPVQIAQQSIKGAGKGECISAEKGARSVAPFVQRKGSL